MLVVEGVVRCQSVDSRIVSLGAYQSCRSIRQGREEHHRIQHRKIELVHLVLVVAVIHLGIRLELEEPLVLRNCLHSQRLVVAVVVVEV